MKVEFSFLDSQKISEKAMIFSSVNFPDNVFFKKGDFIWLSGFKEFLEKGSIQCPEDDEIYAELEEIPTLCKIKDLYHDFSEELGYFMVISVKIK